VIASVSTIFLVGPGETALPLLVKLGNNVNFRTEITPAEGPISLTMHEDAP
jgi:hypothetical protein